MTFADIIHDAFLIDAEKVMQRHVLTINVMVFLCIFNDWTVGDCVFRPHGADGGEDIWMAAPSSVRCCGEDGSAEGGGLRASRRADFHAENVGVNLHEEWILQGDAAAGDDVMDWNTVHYEIVDDFARSKGACFNQCAVDMFWTCSKRHADKHSRQARIIET